MPLTPDRLARLEEMLDRQDIFDCLLRISRGIDRFDRAQFLSGYHPDAVVDAGALVGSAEQAYESGSALHDEGQSATLHNLLNHYCQIDGGLAHCETYFEYAGRNRDGSNWLAGGRYFDRVERRGGEWRVAFRMTIIEWSGTIAGNEVPLFAGVADVHGNGQSLRGPQDPSYRRPLTNLRSISTPEDPRKLSRPKS